jgi:ribosome-associated protein
MTGQDPQSVFDRFELAPGVGAPPGALRWQFARSSGPGGQNVNKVNTKAELWIAVTAISGLSDRAVGRLRTMAGRRLTISDEIHIAADTERTQESNRAAALERLRDLLVEAIHEPKPRRKTKPSRGAKQRRLDSKKRRSQIKAHRRGAD